MSSGILGFLGTPLIYYTPMRNTRDSLDILQGVEYNKGVKAKAPITAGTVTGATIHAAEAERTRNPIIGFCCADLKGSTHDVPQLPDRM